MNSAPISSVSAKTAVKLSRPQDAVVLELVGPATSTVNLVRELGVTIGAATIASVPAISVTPAMPDRRLSARHR
jgi:hypothetical protein